MSSDFPAFLLAKPQLPCPPPSATSLRQNSVSNMSHVMKQESSTQDVPIAGFCAEIPSRPPREGDKAGSG
ncbi:hypothetical protein AV530_014917 [Patagioenas fasciata monilis]|uniref:Uncharacterized protein n=1 Tax=Patagioenas fasciata monilis TaxID=372326 RepID=A0A1V4K0A2_PATFA|nr:hypothetical protein AV530_014917 [Patagioenas fasciata monilis]